MFVAAFVPLAGVLIAGTVAILIVLASKGLIAAVIVLAVLIVMNQLEGHLLQPQVVGKMVRLHPLAVILVLAVAGVVAGIAGAVVAVPITAALTSATRALHHDALALSRAPSARRASGEAGRGVVSEGKRTRQGGAADDHRRPGHARGHQPAGRADHQARPGGPAARLRAAWRRRR
jgi:hypothetical protein